MDADSPIPLLIANTSVSPSSLAVLIVCYILMIFGGAYFAGAEMALASANRIRMMSLAEDSDKRAKRVLYILDNFDKALATLLVGNNLMHIGCATISTVIAVVTWGDGAVSIATMVTTVIVFLISEMLPKYYAKACNERFALAVAGSLIFLMKLLTPMTILFNKFSGSIASHVATAEEELPTVTEDELYDSIEASIEEGALGEETGELLQSALDYKESVVSDVLTPWNDVQTLSTTMTPAEMLAVVEGSIHSRLPVTDPTGAVAGIMHIRRFLKSYIRTSGKLKIKTAMDTPFIVAPDDPIDDLLEKLSANKTHIAIVAGADKKPVGIITVEDILEELVGEIYDEDDPSEDRDESIGQEE